MWWNLHRYLRPFHVTDCLACRKVLAAPKVMCDLCAIECIPWPIDFCTCCGAPMIHARCCKEPSDGSQSRIHISWLYEGSIARSIRETKNGHSISRTAAFVPLIFHNHPDEAFFSGLDLVIPVPPNPSRLKRSGFDLVTEVSAFVAKALSLPLKHRWLIRTRKDGQKGQSRQERKQNALGLYRIAKGHRDLTGKSVLLMDDVRTTGATTDTISELLMAAGCSDVRIWAIAGQATSRSEATQIEPYPSRPKA